MSNKAILVFYAQALLVQISLSQCVNRYAVPSLYGCGYDGTWSRGMDHGPLEPISGKGLTITSISPIHPTGVSVSSDNVFEGPVTVVGELPFLGAVAMEGVLPTAGTGGINYGCGDGVTAMLSEGFGPGAYAVGVYPGFVPPVPDINCVRGLLY